MNLFSFIVPHHLSGTGSAYSIVKEQRQKWFLYPNLSSCFGSLILKKGVYYNHKLIRDIDLFEQERAFIGSRLMKMWKQLKNKLDPEREKSCLKVTGRQNVLC